MKADEQEFTAQSLLDGLCSSTAKKSVNDIFKEQIQRLSDEGQKYMLSLRYVYNTLITFNKHLDIYFSEIDITFLRRLEMWFRKRGVAENTIGIHFLRCERSTM